jgi:hypothetical protein
MKKILVNPNFVYILAFILPFIVYALQWSTLYPKLTTNLVLFYVFTFAVCLILGINIQYTKPFNYKAINISSNNVATLIVVYVLYFIEVIYSHGLPILNVISGSFEYDEYAFGIPVLHTFLISFNTFYAIYLFHQYISTHKIKMIWLFLVALVPFILLVTRSSILHVLLGSFFVFLFSRPSISYKIVIKSIFGIIFILFMFGILGDIRSNSEDPTYIARASGATDEFLDSSVPKQFYWSYLYIASPVANLQNNINYTTVPGGNYKDLVLNEFLPTFLTKFLIPTQEKSFYQINPFLNVGTIYVYSFGYLRWKGLFLMFFYFIAVINFYYYFVIKSDTYKVTGLAILLNIIVFANFHNTIAYSVISVQLIYPIIFSMIKYIKNSRIPKVHV